MAKDIPHMTRNGTQDSRHDEDRQGGKMLTVDDFAAVDVEGPISDSNRVDCASLGQLFSIASSEQETAGNETAAQVFRLLDQIAHMTFKPEDSAEPYGPQYMLADGRRSIVPDDLKGQQSRVLAAIAPGIRNPGLRARLADVAWHNDRASKVLAQVAINAYCDSIRLVRDGQAEIPHTPTNAIGHRGCNMLRRACQIAYATGWKDPERAELRSLIQAVAHEAIDRGHFRDFLDANKLCLQYSIGDTSTIAASAETLASLSTLDPHLSQDLWNLAAEAHRRSGNSQERDRCRVSSAECHVTMADAASGKGMVAASSLMDAIEALRQLPNTKERRQELEKRLRKAQSYIADEMGEISTEFDLTEFVEHARRAVMGVGLAQAIGEFACLTKSPDPSDLRSMVEEQAQEHPISSMMRRSVHDDEGKVVAKSRGYFEVETDDDAARPLIANNESIRRQIDVNGLIEPARRVIHAEHALNLRDFHRMLQKDRESLERIFGAAIVFEIENIFDVRHGPTIRHRLAHGLISGDQCFGSDSIYACWFIFRLCCVPLFSVWQEVADRLDRL